MSSDANGLYVVSLSLHGLLRGFEIELGRDADTGGQILYVVDQVRNLAEDPRVERVDLITREVVDKRVDDSYAVASEPLGPSATIVRIPFGPRRYLYKERLWPFLDTLVDRLMHHLREGPRCPDLIHGHYADAGYVGAQVAGLLGVPFVFTGHSLGRVKEERLLEGGGKKQELERRYNLGQRIEAEELALTSASLVITSTNQEVEQQYALYEQYVPERMEVIPPGVDLGRFSPPREDEADTWIAGQLGRFLSRPGKPMILAIARPDERKNFPRLVKAYATTPGLRERANLVLVAGNRDELAGLDKGARKVLYEILRLVDLYDLYGSVAYPKHHRPEDVPVLYRLAAGTRGVFVNVALTEPFGLTLLEAAASGLPVVATNDGGPRDILARCENGVLVDPFDEDAVGKAILETLSDAAIWKRLSAAGIEGSKHYSWKRHVDRYLTEVERMRRGYRPGLVAGDGPPTRLKTMDRILITDVDGTLTGDEEGLRRFAERLRGTGETVGFGIGTGRSMDSVMDLLRTLDVPQPDILLTSVGTEIRYGRDLALDRSWARHIDYQWDPERVMEVMNSVEGADLQDEDQQRLFKISYVLDSRKPTGPRDVLRILRKEGLRVRTVFSHGMYLDILPIRASEGQALRFLGYKWNLPLDRILVVGDSGNDMDMLAGDTLGAVVGNYSEELEPLRGRPRVYFAEAEHARGILEAIDHYDFFGDITIPGEGS